MRRAHTVPNQLRDAGSSQTNRLTETEIPRSNIQSTSNGQVDVPKDGEQFDTSEDAFNRVQQYAIASGFAVVQKEVDRRNGGYLFSCVYSGKSKNTHKFLDSTGMVSKEIIEGLGGLNIDGKKPRLRSGQSMNLGCPFQIAVSQQAKFYHSGPLKDGLGSTWTLQMRLIGHNHPLQDSTSSHKENSDFCQGDKQPVNDAAADHEPQNSTQKHTRIEDSKHYASSKASQSDLDRFFGRYPEFDYKRERNAAREFQRLASDKGWIQADKKLKELKKSEEKLKNSGKEKDNQPKKKISPEEKHRLERLASDYRSAKTGFYQAFQKEFNAIFDKEYLCELLELEIPESGLRKMLENVNVNIYELHHYEQALRNGRSAKIMDVTPEILEKALAKAGNFSKDGTMLRFRTVRDLGDYSIKHDLIYPKALAKDEGALKHMLRRIIRPCDIQEEEKKLGRHLVA